MSKFLQVRVIAKKPEEGKRVINIDHVVECIPLLVGCPEPRSVTSILMSSGREHVVTEDIDTVLGWLRATEQEEIRR